MREIAFTPLLLSIVTLLTALPLHAKDMLYNCPDLHDSSKRSIEPLTQGYEGWFFRENDMKTDFSLSPQSLAYFKRLHDTLKANNIDLVMLPLLSRAMMASDMVNTTQPMQELYDIDIAVASYQEMIAQLRQTGIAIPSLYTLYIKRDDDDPYAYNFKRDIHWKPAGAALVAQGIAPLIKQIPGYADLPKIDVTNTKQAEISRFGTIMEELQKLCTSKITAEQMYLMERTQTVQEDASALFGDSDETTPLAIVGTSFTARDVFSFPAYLEEYADLEVANFAVAGGGMFTSIVSYLSTPFFHENPPKILLWEIQSIYDGNKGIEQQFRQVIPAIHGVCNGNDVIARNKVGITGDGSTILLDGLEDKAVTGTDYYLYMYADNLGFNEFSLQLEYADKDGDLFPINRSYRYGHKGHYYVELSDQISSNLSYVTLQNTGNADTTLDVVLCKAPAEEQI